LLANSITGTFSFPGHGYDPGIHLSAAASLQFCRDSNIHAWYDSRVQASWFFIATQNLFGLFLLHPKMVHLIDNLMKANSRNFHREKPLGSGGLFLIRARRSGNHFILKNWKTRGTMLQAGSARIREMPLFTPAGETSGKTGRRSHDLHIGAVAPAGIAEME